jgi:hypothetical protein
MLKTGSVDVNLIMSEKGKSWMVNHLHLCQIFHPLRYLLAYLVSLVFVDGFSILAALCTDRSAQVAFNQTPLNPCLCKMQSFVLQPSNLETQ